MPGPQASLLPGIPSLISIHCLWLQLLELIFPPREVSLAGYPICFQFQIFLAPNSSLGVSVAPSTSNGQGDLAQVGCSPLGRPFWNEGVCFVLLPGNGSKSFRRTVLGKMNVASIAFELLVTLPPPPAPMPCDPILPPSPLIAQETVIFHCSANTPGYSVTLQRVTARSPLCGSSPRLCFPFLLRRILV